MNDYTLAEVFDDVYLQEFSEFDKPAGHLFSLRHRRAMKEILYPRTIWDRIAPPLKKRVFIAVLVILLSMLGIAVGAVMSRSFALEERRGHIELHAINDKNAPATIDTLYHLPAIPAGLEPLYEDHGRYNIYINYFDAAGERYLFFDQGVKNGFTISRVEQSYFEEAQVNGNPAYYLCFNPGGGIIVWDNEDYIMEVGGSFTKDELIALAESVEPKGE